MEEQADYDDSWLFVVYFTRQAEPYEPANAELTIHHVHIPSSVCQSSDRASNRYSPSRSSKLALAVLNAVLKRRPSAQNELFPDSDWNLRFSQCGPVDEFTLGVQAVFLDPSGKVASLLAMHFPEGEV